MLLKKVDPFADAVDREAPTGTDKVDQAVPTKGESFVGGDAKVAKG